MLSHSCKTQKSATDSLPVKDLSYDKYWKKIDSLRDQGLVESMVEPLDELMAFAKMDDNHPQLLKALMYRGQLIEQYEESGSIKAIDYFKSQVTDLEEPSASVAKSMLGELYARYVNSNLWRINQRTAIASSDEGQDLGEWSARRIYEESDLWYIASTEAQDILKETPLDEYSLIVTNQDKTLDPNSSTLYDLLAHRKLMHLQNGSRDYQVDPAGKYLLDKSLFAPAKEFISSNLSFGNTRVQEILMTYQDLIAFHQSTSRSRSMVNADLARLDWAYQKSALSDKNELLILAWDGLVRVTSDPEAKAEVLYRKAEHISNLARNQENQPWMKASSDYTLVVAMSLAQDIIASYPQTNGANKARNLVASISNKEMSAQLESAVLPDKPFPFSLRYRNLDKVYLRVVRLKESDVTALYEGGIEDYLNYFTKRENVTSWELDLPSQSDYKQRIVESKIDALPVGLYGIIMSADPSFDRSHGFLGAKMVQVTNIAFWQVSAYEEDGYLQIVDRADGAAKAGVEVEFYETDYNRRRSQLVFRSDASTDRDGRVPIANKRGHMVKLKKGNDIYFPEERIQYRQGYKPQRQRDQALIFTDRAIYRQGQQLHFKTILYTNVQDQEPRLASNQSVTVTLNDANGELIKSLELVSNEFGSASGSFSIPRGRLNGQYRISTQKHYGNHAIRVEDYKRPNFEVKLKDLEQEYVLDDDVNIKGTAMALASYGLDNAQVKYRVYRQVSYPCLPWRYGRYLNMMSRDDILLGGGETTTDEKGGFNISFSAIPDLSVQRELKPVFVYRVEIDVIDQTGETQSATRSFNIGYMSLRATWNPETYTTKDRLKPISVSVTNLDGNSIQSNVEMRVEKLQRPVQFIHSRLWPEPSAYIHSEEEWQSWFPHLPYKEEDKVGNWKTLDQSYAQSERATTEASFDLSSLAAGSYKLTLKLIGAKGEPYVEERFLHILGATGVLDEAITDHTGQEDHGPGQIALSKWMFSTSSDVYLYRGEMSSLDQTAIVIGAKAHDQRSKVNQHGAFSLFASTYFDNRHYQASRTVNVPYHHKNLEIKLETFREELEPGEEESYTVKISNHQAEGVRAEILAAMYDASLDAFVDHRWAVPSLFPSRTYRGQAIRQWYPNFYLNMEWYPRPGENHEIRYPSYPQLNWHGWYGGYGGGYHGTDMVLDEVKVMRSKSRRAQPTSAPVDREVMEESGGVMADQLANDSNMPKEEPAIRSDFAESVFFYPQLESDQDGNVSFEFKMPESLTRWNLLLWSHDKEFRMGTQKLSLVTKKDLSVNILMPRFLREGDDIKIPTKLVNLTDQDQSVSVELSLLDEYGQVHEKISCSEALRRSVSIPANQSVNVYWPINVSDDYTGAATVRALVQGDRHSDGEERTIPILTNRVLVTESLPLPIRAGEEREFFFTSFERKLDQDHIKTHRLSVEFSSNPVWYAVQALPYLQDFPHECAEQLFSKFYANALAAHVATSKPSIKKIFEQWEGEDELKSKLLQNEELKAALIEETPWLMEAKSETQRMQQIALLFDFNKMSQEAKSILDRVTNMQLGNGAWPWFAGGRPNRRITLHLVEWWTHLEALGVLTIEQKKQFAAAISKAQQYLNRELAEEYRRLEEAKRRNPSRFKWDDDHLSGYALHYLYTMSRSKEWNQTGLDQNIVDYYRSQVLRYRNERSLHMQGYMAFVLWDMGETQALSTLLQSIVERSISHDELGMYWKSTRGHGWYERPIETHALMIELFETMNQSDVVDELRIWLLKNKQANSWKTTKATAWAIYSLLLSGDDWLVKSALASVVIDGQDLSEGTDAQAGSLYYKRDLAVSGLSAKSAKITVSNPNEHIAWGAVHWQYFANRDKIESKDAEGPLQLKKELYVRDLNTQGRALELLDENDRFAPGDEIIVRITLEADREMEYIHMKDYRAAGLEPTETLSRHRWQEGLSYYQSTRDMATHFFIEKIYPGQYVFEYSLRVQHPGDFSNGHCLIESMYAPEYRAHSDGRRLSIDER